MKKILFYYILYIVIYAEVENYLITLVYVHEERKKIKFISEKYKFCYQYYFQNNLKSNIH